MLDRWPRQGERTRAGRARHERVGTEHLIGEFSTACLLEKPKRTGRSSTRSTRESWRPARRFLPPRTYVPRGGPSKTRKTRALAWAGHGGFGPALSVRQDG